MAQGTTIQRFQIIDADGNVIAASVLDELLQVQSRNMEALLSEVLLELREIKELLMFSR